MKTKSIKDFERLINQTKEVFAMEKIYHNRNFKDKRETFGDVEVFTIVNHFRSVIIKFDTETAHIAQKEIFNSDLPNINNMLKELSGETEWNS